MEMSINTFGLDCQEMMELWFLSRTKEVLLQMSDNNFMEGDLVKWMKLKPLTLDSTNTLLGECTGILPVASQCSQWKTTNLVNPNLD